MPDRQRWAEHGRGHPAVAVPAVLLRHRFTLGRPVSAILQIVSVFVQIGVVWLLVDAVLIPGMIRQTKQAMRDRRTLDALNQMSATALPYVGAGEMLPTHSHATLPVPR